MVRSLIDTITPWLYLICIISSLDENVNAKFKDNGFEADLAMFLKL